VQAITALCTGAYRLSKRTTQQLLEELFGVTMSLGTVSTLEAATVAAVAAPVEAARAFVQEQRCEPLSPSEAHQSTTKSDGIWRSPLNKAFCCRTQLHTTENL
jgi:hypothetical protein